ncbi:tetratricopeptide repeat protein [soil metagenome]
MDWEERLAAAWASVDGLDDGDVLELIDGLVDELPATDARGPFEAASVRDYLGLEALAEPLYRRSLELGLDGERLPQAQIQLASTLRNLGRLDEAIDLLRARLAESPTDRWAAPASAFLALTLASRGDDRLAASVALIALADFLPAYGRAVRSYAAEL